MRPTSSTNPTRAERILPPGADRKEGHVDDGFDASIHSLARLRLMSALAGSVEMEFATARDLLDVSDSVLSRHLALLRRQGYVRLRKATVDTRRRTWIVATDPGRSAYERHAAALVALVSGRSPASGDG